MVATFDNYVPSGIYSPDVTPLTMRLSQAMQQAFSGNLCFQMAGSDAEQEVWKLTFRHGRLVWATAGNHRVRRWLCLTNRRCTSPAQTRHELNFSPDALPWEYQLLQRLLDLGWVEREMVNTIVRQNLCEVLFDLVQFWNSGDQLDCDITEEAEKAIEPFIFLGVDELLNETHIRWQAWCCAQLQTYTPSMAPTIRHAEKLKRKVSEKTFRNLTIMLQDKRSLRELATLTNRDMAKLAEQFIPYERLGMIRFESVADLPIESSGQVELTGSVA